MTPTAGTRVPAGDTADIMLVVNGTTRVLPVEARVSLLDALGEYAGLTGTKKGCNQRG